MTPTLLMSVTTFVIFLPLKWTVLIFSHSQGAVVSFFEYDNQLRDVDLQRYQIYTEYDNPFDGDKPEDPCIVHSLRLSGVNEDKIQLIHANLSGYFMRKSDLKKVAELLGINIELDYTGGSELRLGAKNKTRKNLFHSRFTGEPYIKLCCFRNHLFVNEVTKYSSYCIKNYQMVKYAPRWWDIQYRSL